MSSPAAEVSYHRSCCAGCCCCCCCMFPVTRALPLSPLPLPSAADCSHPPRGLLRRREKPCPTRPSRWRSCLLRLPLLLHFAPASAVPLRARRTRTGALQRAVSEHMAQAGMHGFSDGMRRCDQRCVCATRKVSSLDPILLAAGRATVHPSRTHTRKLTPTTHQAPSRAPCARGERSPALG